MTDATDAIEDMNEKINGLITALESIAHTCRGRLIGCDVYFIAEMAEKALKEFGK